MSPPTPHHPDFSACLAWAARHWQSESDLRTALDTLQAFQAQRDLLADAERGNFEATVRAAPWLPPEAGDRRPIEALPAVRWLDTPEQARAVMALAGRRPLQLGVSELRPEVAGVLAGHAGELALPGVRHLNWPVAQALAQRPAGRAMLTLGSDGQGIDGLAGLEPYWSRPDAYIRLPAIRRLNDESAEVLSRIRGTLSLPNLNVLTPAHAAQLARGNLIKLELDGLPDAALTPELAQGLSSGQLKGLALNRITQQASGLPPLLGHPGWRDLYLDGLKTLPQALASGFKRNTLLLTLTLNGLTELDLPTARALCGEARAFSLHLDGLTRLDDAVVGVLVGNSNSLLAIQQVKEISPTARRMLYDQGNVDCPALD